MTFTANDLFSIVKQMAASDIKELGSSDTAQNSYLFQYASRALKELAGIAFQTRISDALNIVSDGDQTFQYSGSAIADLYAPLRILNSSGSPIQKRMLYESPVGWWKESAAAAINTRGITGNHTLHYVRYPADVASTTDPVEFPDSGMMGLAFWICGIVKESANGYEEAQVMYQRSTARLKIAVQANVDGRGVTTGGWAPSTKMIDTVYKG